MLWAPAPNCSTGPLLDLLQFVAIPLSLEVLSLAAVLQAQVHDSGAFILSHYPGCWWKILNRVGLCQSVKNTTDSELRVRL